MCAGMKTLKIIVSEMIIQLFRAETARLLTKFRKSYSQWGLASLKTLTTSNTVNS